jgi:hypothetical protein
MPAKDPELDVVYEIARSRLDRQLDFLDSLDNRLGLFLSVGAAVETIVVAVLAVDHARWTLLMWAGFVLSVAAFVAIAFWTLMALRLSKWGIGPKVKRIAAVQHRHGSVEATRHAINTMTDLFEENVKAYDAKVAAILPAAIALGLQILASAAAVASVAQPS